MSRPHRMADGPSAVRRCTFPRARLPGRTAVVAVTCVLMAGCYQPPEAAPGPGDGTTYVDGGSPEPAELVGFPLASFPPHGSATVKTVGSEFATGSLVVFNRGTEDLRILSVEPELRGEGLAPLGAQSAGEARTIGYIQEVDGWPVDGEPELGPLRDAVGTVVPASTFGAERGVSLLLGLRVTEPGRSTVQGVTVRYVEVGDDREQEATFVSTLAVCTPPVLVDDCDFEYAGS